MASEIEELSKLIKRFEGCQLKAYICPAGVVTCGWGSTGPDISLKTVWTQKQADERMLRDAQKFLNEARKLCPNLSGNKLAAVADFCYNLGSGRLRTSTLRKKILAEDWEAVPSEFRKWVNGGGKKLKGLVIRREAEIELFFREEVVTVTATEQAQIVPLSFAGRLLNFFRSLK